MSKRIPVEILKIRDNARLPVYATDGAAAADVFVSEIEVPYPWLRIVKLGFATDIPPGWEAKLTPRSGFSDKGWAMTNSPGIIDSDYRGEWIMKFIAIPQEAFWMAAPRLVEGPTYSIVGPGLNDPQMVPSRLGIDPGRPGLTLPPFPYQIGDRCGQVQFQEVTRGHFIVVDTLSETLRGAGGFGSTGTR